MTTKALFQLETKNNQFEKNKFEVNWGSLVSFLGTLARTNSPALDYTHLDSMMGKIQNENDRLNKTIIEPLERVIRYSPASLLLTLCFSAYP